VIYDKYINTKQALHERESQGYRLYLQHGKGLPSVRKVRGGTSERVFIPPHERIRAAAGGGGIFLVCVFSVLLNQIKPALKSA
jgi:hypothetical protein